jgi:hypothetical protein
MRITDFISSGPCKQRQGIRVKGGKVITTCPECPGIMKQGDCARDRLIEAAKREE